MPQSEVIFYREGDTIPIRDWLKKQPIKIQIKCLAYIAQLEVKGHELRRPVADFLRDGIYELRPSYQGINYRILYFFAGKSVVVVSHGLKKENDVPVLEIKRAIERKRKFEADPAAHVQAWEIEIKWEFVHGFVDAEAGADNAREKEVPVCRCSRTL